jgi:hypothetical protein
MTRAAPSSTLTIPSYVVGAHTLVSGIGDDRAIRMLVYRPCPAQPKTRLSRAVAQVVLGPRKIDIAFEALADDTEQNPGR